MSIHADDSDQQEPPLSSAYGTPPSHQREYNENGKDRREFPKTRVRTPTNLRILEDDKDEDDEEEEDEGKSKMGSSDDLKGYYTSSSSNRSRCSREYYNSNASSVSQASSQHFNRRNYPSQRRREFYPGDKTTSSPYVRRDRSGDYIALRQQQSVAAAAVAAAEFERIQHHSSSRTDLLDHDHNSLYDHYTPPPNQYSFVRTCDGNFVKTLLPPIHKYEPLDATSSGSCGSTYYRANHTLRRPSKRSTHGEFCCREDYAGLNAQYATLRGRKWVDKSKGGGGCGDNYGRVNYIQSNSEARSFTDDFVSGQPHASHANALVLQAINGNPSKALSKSTDKNLNTLGVGEEEVLPTSDVSPLNNNGSKVLQRCSNEVINLLIREPPDGKEKPEPAKKQNHNENTLSRNSSKGDLLDVRDIDISALKPDRDSIKEGVYDGHSEELETKDCHILRKPIPSSPRGVLSQPTLSSGHGASTQLAPSSVKTTVLVSTAAPTTATPTSSAVQVQRCHPSSTSRQYGQTLPSSHPPQTSVYNQPLPRNPRISFQWAITAKVFMLDGLADFFGVDEKKEENAKTLWTDRRRRLAIKRFGGVKDELNPGYQVDSNTYSSQYGDCSRLRYDHHLTSEMEGDKMVLKITKPPRNKDSFSSLTRQSISWVLKQAFATQKIPNHPVVMEHDVSRSYQPSTTGIAAYYQAEQTGGLAICPPLPRVPSTHHIHGESPAEEVFFTKPNVSEAEELHANLQGKRIAYPQDPYRTTTSSWQLPRPDQDLPRMSSDVGASRIWNRLLDAAFDNSDRRKHGMGFLGRVLHRKRVAKRRGPAESSRKRKLAGNSTDYRPYFTYWITFVQIFVLFISVLVYGIGPVGIDFYKKAGMVLVTNLELEPVDHLEPANFWIGPSTTDLIHLGAKYAPCMRWDQSLQREIQEERNKERDTACCIRKDRAGCVQSPKSECSKVSDSTPRSNWWRPSEWGSKYQYPNENRRSSGPVCGLDPAYCEAPASVAPYIWPDDITKWPICRKKTELENLDQTGHTAEHMVCEIIGHPCCIGIRGHCQITTREYCMFVSGTFHEEAALCSQVSCLDDVCGLIPFRQRDVPDQLYRVLTPMFLHAGLLHLALTIALQYWLMRDLEKMAGATRISIIYIGSGMIGNLASAIFVPYRAEIGPSGAHFGLLACSMVEIIHEWPTLKYPEMAILKLIGIVSFFFLLGLLPWIDNYGHLFGFIGGFFLSCGLLPFVSFGTYDRKRKIILIWICLITAFFLFLGLILIFYISPLHDCEICRYFNCIPITKDFCANHNIGVREAI